MSRSRNASIAVEDAAFELAGGPVVGFERQLPTLFQTFKHLTVEREFDQILCMRIPLPFVEPEMVVSDLRRKFHRGLPWPAWLLIGSICVSPRPAASHESLYQYIEVRKVDPGKHELSVPIHLAELATDYGIDPSRGDLTWWNELSQEQKEEIMKRAREFLAASFIFEDETLSPRLEASLSPSRISAEEGDSIRPGCAVASITIPTTLEELLFSYHLPGKRLMLVVNRPGKFPEVYDHPSPAVIPLPLH